MLSQVVLSTPASIQSSCRATNDAVKLFSSSCSLMVKLSSLTTVLLTTRSEAMELLRSTEAQQLGRKLEHHYMALRLCV